MNVVHDLVCLSQVRHLSTEAEYRALASVVAEIVWIRKLVHTLTRTAGRSLIFCEALTSYGFDLLLSSTNGPVFNAVKAYGYRDG